MVKYRFALNSCSSCHMDGFTSRNADYSPSVLEAGRALGFGDIPFSQNILDENRPLANGGFETIDLRGSRTSFFHFAFGSGFSAFLREDLIHRENELEFQLSVASCEEEEVEQEIVDVDVQLEVSNDSPEVNERVNFIYKGENVGSGNIINLEVTNVNCPEGFSLNSINMEHENGDMDWSGGIWIFKNIAPGVSRKLTLTCTALESSSNTTIIHELKEKDFKFSSPQVDTNLDNHLVLKELSIKEKLVDEIVDIELNLEIDKSNPEVDEIVNFKVKAKNVGDKEIKAFKIKKIICPDEFSVVNISLESGSKIEVRDWAIDSILPGSDINLSFNCRVLESTKGRSIEYSINHDQFEFANNQMDENLENHEVGSIIEVKDSKNVDIEAKIVPFGFDTLNELQTVSYRVELNNLGPDTASSVSLNVSCPDGTDQIGNAAITAGIFSNADKLWVIGSIEANKKEGINLTCKIKNNQAGKLIEFRIKSENISTAEKDLNRDNEESHAILRVLERKKESDLELFSTINNLSPVEGEEITFRVGVVNKGPDESGIISIIARCPADSVEIRRSVSVSSSKLWTINNLLVDNGDRIKAKIQELVCKVNEGTEGKKLKFSIPSSDFFMSLHDGDKTNNTTSIEFEINEKLDEKKVSDIKATLDVLTPEVKAGESIFLKIDLENIGPEVATEMKYDVLCPEQLNTVPIQISISKGSFSSSGTKGQWKISSFGVREKAVLSYRCATSESITNKDVQIKLKQEQLTLDDKNVDNNINNHISNNKNIKISGLRVCDLDLSEPRNSSVGISTLDIVQLQRHILGIALIGEKEPNPGNEAHLMNVFGGKKLDNNGDGRVSAIDLINMRKWILGHYSSWEEAFKNSRTVDDCDIYRPFENNRFEAIKGN